MAKAAELNDDHETIFYPLYVMILNYWFPADDGCMICPPCVAHPKVQDERDLQCHFRLYGLQLELLWARDCRHYNVPNSRQGLAAIISGDIDALLNTRDIIIRYRGGVLCTTEVHPSYVAPRSPLLSPTGQPSLSLEMRYTYTASAVWRKILSGGQVPPSTQGLIGKLSHYKQTPIPTFPISHRLGLDHIPSEIKWQGDSLGVSTTAHASRSGRRRPQKARPEYTRANRNPEDGSPTPTPFPSTKQKAKRKVLIIDDVEAAGAEEKRKLRKDDAGCLYMWSGDCS
ncbi:hypothetical protein V8E53_005201 [Lactarius tabidus]